MCDTYIWCASECFGCSEKYAAHSVLTEIHTGYYVLCFMFGSRVEHAAMKREFCMHLNRIQTTTHPSYLICSECERKRNKSKSSSLKLTSEQPNDPCSNSLFSTYEPKKQITNQIAIPNPSRNKKLWSSSSSGSIPSVFISVYFIFNRIHMRRRLCRPVSSSLPPLLLLLLLHTSSLFVTWFYHPHENILFSKLVKFSPCL